MKSKCSRNKSTRVHSSVSGYRASTVFFMFLFHPPCNMISVASSLPRIKSKLLNQVPKSCYYSEQDKKNQMTAATRNITVMMLKDSQKQPPNSYSSQPQQTATGHQAQTAVRQPLWNCWPFCLTALLGFVWLPTLFAILPILIFSALNKFASSTICGNIKQ